MDYGEHLQAIREWDNRLRTIKRLRNGSIVLAIVSVLIFCGHLYYLVHAAPGCK